MLYSPVAGTWEVMALLDVHEDTCTHALSFSLSHTHTRTQTHTHTIYAAVDVICDDMAPLDVYVRHTLSLSLTHTHTHK